MLFKLIFDKIGMSKRRLQHVLAGQEMLESSGSDSDSEVGN